MALKRRHKIEATFSMASMTDVIFLLLIFFMITSTIVFPNSIKVDLPQSSQQEPIKPITKVTIDAQLNYYITIGNEEAKPVSFEQLTGQMGAVNVTQEEGRFVALYADESVPYGEIVKVLSLANDNNLKMVLATQPKQKP